MKEKAYRDRDVPVCDGRSGPKWPGWPGRRGSTTLRGARRRRRHLGKTQLRSITLYSSNIIRQKSFISFTVILYWQLVDCCHWSQISSAKQVRRRHHLRLSCSLLATSIPQSRTLSFSVYPSSSCPRSSTLPAMSISHFPKPFL